MRGIVEKRPNIGERKTEAFCRAYESKPACVSGAVNLMGVICIAGRLQHANLAVVPNGVGGDTGSFCLLCYVHGFLLRDLASSNSRMACIPSVFQQLHGKAVNHRQDQKR